MTAPDLIRVEGDPSAMCEGKSCLLPLAVHEPVGGREDAIDTEDADTIRAPLRATRRLDGLVPAPSELSGSHEPCKHDDTAGQP